MTAHQGAPGFEDEGEGTRPPPPSVAPVEAGTSSPNGVGARISYAWKVLLGRSAVQRVVGETQDHLQVERTRNENRYRDLYARSLLAVMCAQVAFADWFLYRIAREHHFTLSDTVLVAFIGSVVAEIIGLVLVITQSLFPDSSRKSSPSDSPAE